MERKISVAEMRILRWMNEVTREDRIKNEYIRGSIEVAPIVDNLSEYRLRWVGHVLRREKIEAVSVISNIGVDRKRRGRPKKRWFEFIEYDMRMTGDCEKDVKHRSKWKLRTRVVDPKQLGDKAKEKKN